MRPEIHLVALLPLFAMLVILIGVSIIFKPLIEKEA